jgi:hemimethylated DNA binding protein
MIYKVGDVVKTKVTKEDKMPAHGVIIGWDLEMKAPQEFIDQVLETKKGQLFNLEELKADTHYLILLDSIDAGTVFDQVRYVRQDEIEVPTNSQKRILNNALGEYYEGYKNGRYIKRPWLENMYPRD